MCRMARSSRRSTSWSATADLSTITGSLAAGTPLVIVPQGRDQDDNAERVHATGVGLALPRDADPAAIAAAIRRVLHEPSFRIAAAADGRGHRDGRGGAAAAAIVDREVARARERATPPDAWSRPADYPARVPPTDVDRVSLLLGTSLFDDLSPAELEPLARAATVRRVVRGEHVFEAGDPADALYIVATGQLRDAIYSDEGAEITHSLWEPGQCFGEVGFFARGRTRVMSVLALEPSTSWSSVASR